MVAVHSKFCNSCIVNCGQLVCHPVVKLMPAFCDAEALPHHVVFVLKVCCCHKEVVRLKKGDGVRSFSVPFFKAMGPHRWFSRFILLAHIKIGVHVLSLV